MANEATIVELLGNRGDPVDYTVDNALAIEKGAILKLVDPRSVSGADTVGQAVAGIAAAEKVASDGQTNIAVYTNGIFDLLASGAISLGAPVVSTGWNEVQQAADTVAVSGAAILGYALETAADNETIEVKVKL